MESVIQRRLRLAYYLQLIAVETPNSRAQLLSKIRAKQQQPNGQQQNKVEFNSEHARNENDLICGMYVGLARYITQSVDQREFRHQRFCRLLIERNLKQE